MKGQSGAHRRLRTASLAAASVVLGALVLVEPVHGASVGGQIDFEGLAPGTVVTDQYQSVGVAFGLTPIGTSPGPVILSAPGVARSGSQVAQVTESCGVEVSLTAISARFNLPTDFVQVFLSDVEAPSASYPATLTAQGIDGSVLATDKETVTGSGWTRLSVNRPSFDIGYVQIAAPGAHCLAMDDFAFDGSVSTTPDFGLALVGSDIGTSDGHSGSGTIVVGRFVGSTGQIQLSATNLPAGVTASFTPDPLTGSALFALVTLTLTADATAPPVTDQPITVTGTAIDATAGDPNKPHSITVPVTVANTYTLVAKSIEVTQGIQSQGLPARDLGNPSVGTLASPLAYQGIGLQANRKTIARVFADLVNVDSVDGVSAELFGLDQNGQLLPGTNPILPDNQPTVTATHPFSIAVTYPQRVDALGTPFEFTLPDGWTAGRGTRPSITLRAVLAPPGQLSFDSPTQAACDSPDCLSLREVALGGVAFDDMFPVTIATIHANLEGNEPATPDIVFAQALKVTPGSITITPYQGDVELVDLNNIVNPSSAQLDQMDKTALQRIIDWDNDHGHPGDMVAGVISGIEPGGTPDPDIGMEGPGAPSVVFAGRPAAVVSQMRPLSSVGHETNHALSRIHTQSSGCGQSGDFVKPFESWPPDQRGDIEGIGFDVDTHTVNGPGTDGTPEWFDLMSYCLNVHRNSTGSGVDGPNIWNSDRGWTEVFDCFSTVQHAQPCTVPQPPPTPLAPPLGTMDVMASVASTGASVDIVHPSTAGLPSTASSAYHLRVLDAAGNVLSDTPMRADTTHTQPTAAGTGGTITLLEVQVPSAGAASVQVTFNGAVVAQRTRSAHAPVVTLVAPQPLAVLGAAATTQVRWTSSDADGDPLTAKVDFSRDGGLTWQTVFSGPDHGQATYPSSYLPGSPTARIRVRVNDGFNETAVVSGPLVALGSVPTVSISDPATSATFRDDAVIRAGGRAFDDAFRPIPGLSLAWFVDGFPAGLGATAAIGPLPPGQHTLTLVAHDGIGRVGSAQRTITVAPVQPLLLQLRHPASVGSCEDEVTLTVASSVPGVLLVNGQTFIVGRLPVLVPVLVPAGSSPVQLSLTLTAFGLSSSGSLTLPRTGC